MSKRIRTCTVCEQSKERKEFAVVEGKRSTVCKACDTEGEVDATFQAEIANMGADFIPVNELTFPEE